MMLTARSTGAVGFESWNDAMELAQLIDGLALRIVSGDPSVSLTDLVDDSRQVTPGSAFVFRPAGGQSEPSPRAWGYLEEALARGAAAVIDVHLEALVPPFDWPGSAARVQVVPSESGQGLIAQLADRFFGSPSEELALLGVTGTNGKTTLTFIAQHLLTKLGMKAGLIGTVFTDVGSPDGPTPATLTTPGAIEVHRTLRAMRQQGCDACVMEVSSHALHQGRADALAFDAAVFTNLTGEHLDYHQDMAGYARAKARLFETLDNQAVAVINIDDDHWLEMVPTSDARIVYTTLSAGAHDLAPLARATIHDMTARGSAVTLDGPWGQIAVTLPWVGAYNVSNALQAVAAVHAMTGCDAEALTQSLQTCPAVPGRLEPVTLPGSVKHPMVWVDYAHTHDALENVLRAVKPLTAGRLIVVLGCGGDRDRTKRPKMAQVAQQWADAIYLTSDNPRTEDPQAILSDMIAGLSDPHAGTVEPDRAVAIAQAIANADPNDVVLIAGKGHEDYQLIAWPKDSGGASGEGVMKIPFDDRQHATRALQHRAREAHTPCEPLT